MGRPRIRTARLGEHDQQLIWHLFGSLRNAYEKMGLDKPVAGIKFGVFYHVMSNRLSSPEVVAVVRHAWQTWAKTYLKRGVLDGEVTRAEPWTL